MFKLILDLTDFRHDDVVHSESEAKVGEFNEDSDSCFSDYSSKSQYIDVIQKLQSQPTMLCILMFLIN